VDLGLAGRIVVVTGGTSGIGLEAVRRFVSEGARVAFCARNAARIAEVTSGLASDDVLGFCADVRESAAMTAFAAATRERFGGIDILVENAGESRMKPLADLSDAEWSDELELKMFSVLRPLRAFLPDLMKSAIPAVVYISSLLAKVPETRLIASSAARAGALNLIKALSFELVPVRVNSILLGVIDTGQWERRWRERVASGDVVDRATYLRDIATDRGIPLGRVGTAAEVAAAIAFLASPLSGFTTGAMLEISGGFSRHV
jgi:NAD(P)-dependent dehydrogenase (short-subunit alcohol dehydrogenase family)